MGSDQREPRKVIGDPVEVHGAGVFAWHGLEDVTCLHGDRQPDLLTFGIKGIHSAMI